MSVIDPNILNSARKIRSDYNQLVSIMGTYEKEVQSLATFYQKIASDLEEYTKNKIKEKSIKETEKFLLQKMDELDIESKKLSIKIDPVSKKIENLRDEWNTLYHVIKEKYPDISDENILKEINNS